MHSLRQLLLLWLAFVRSSQAFQSTNLLLQRDTRSSNALTRTAPTTNNNIRLGHHQPRTSAAANNNNNSTDESLLIQTATNDISRRSLLAGLGLASPFVLHQEESSAVLNFGNREQQSKIFYVSSDKNASDSLQSEQLDLDAYTLNSEICLLKLLPVKNPVFRDLEKSVVGLSALKTSQLTDVKPWAKAAASISAAIAMVDTKRGRLEPIFNPDESTMMQILKGERGEQTIEEFRNALVELENSTMAQNLTRTLQLQKRALLSLVDVGGFLVRQFPYDVPTEGIYSYLPRLLGRAKVTFEMRRRKRILGNLTIIADGFAAPITAGNFVDLSIRNFYTGLPVKLSRKKVGSSTEFEVASIPILGSFQEGFYDPLTATLRRVPLEIIRLESAKGSPKLSYAEDDASTTGNNLFDFSDKPASISKGNGKSLLSFDIPGLVALNHPDKTLNGGSSEFFSLQSESLPENKRRLLDGEYAPFGYIVEGYDLFLSLLPGDIIESTSVDEIGQLNLLKLRQSSFSEVVQSSENSNNNVAEEQPAKKDEPSKQDESMTNGDTAKKKIK